MMSFKIPKVSDSMQLALVLTVGTVALWYVSRKIGQAGDAAANVLTGETEAMQGTPYQGAGIIGTLGHATNELLGGAPQAIGETLGGWLFDFTHPTVTKSSGSVWDSLIGGTH